MANFVNNLKINQNELQKAVIHLLASAPASPAEGQVYHDTTTNHLNFYTGSAWQDVTDALTLGGNVGSYYLARANHTGTQAQTTVTNLVSDLAAKAPLASPTFTGTPLAPTASSGTNTTQIATTAYVIAEIAARIAAANALVYKGAIDASTDPNYPAADSGDMYKISVAGHIGGASGPAVEVGDTIICFVDSSAAGNHATVGANWDIIQTNIDGAVTLTGSQTLTNKTLTSPVINSPTGIVKGDVGLGNVDNTSDATKNSAVATLTNKTLTSPKINVGSDATGDIYYRDSGGNLARLPIGSSSYVLTVAAGLPSWAAAASSAIRYSEDIGDGAATDIVVTHNLGTRDLVASIREVGSPYEVVDPGVEFTTINTATIRFSVAPSASQYRLTLVG